MQEKFDNGSAFLRHIYEIRRLVLEKTATLDSPLLIAIDGRSSSGKSTLSSLLFREGLAGAILHTDDFYLPLSLRTSERMAHYCGHMDLSRLEREALIPHALGQEIKYRPFSCKRQAFLETLVIPRATPIVLEGSYSLFPSLRKYSHIRILLDTDCQSERLLAREGEEGLLRFEKMWLPREEEYLAATHPEQIADIIIKT